MAENSGGKTAKRRRRGRPFAKGQSGNPGGRPKTGALSEALKEELGRVYAGQSAAERIARKLVKAALAGRAWAIREVWDRSEGKPRQAVELSVDVPPAELPAKLERILETLARQRAKEIGGR